MAQGEREAREGETEVALCRRLAPILVLAASAHTGDPSDRQATFDPPLITKYHRRICGFDEKIISMYARGMSAQEIVRHLRDLYGVDVSPDLISVVTDAELEEIAVWQTRPLEPVYPLVLFDSLRARISDMGFVRNKAVHIALNVRAAVQSPSAADLSLSNPMNNLP